MEVEPEQKQDQIEIKVPCRPEFVRTVRRAVADFAESLDVPESMIAEIEVAASEAVTNVVRHAYSGGKQEDTGIEGDKKSETPGQEYEGHTLKQKDKYVDRQQAQNVHEARILQLDLTSGYSACKGQKTTESTRVSSEKNCQSSQGYKDDTDGGAQPDLRGSHGNDRNGHQKAAGHYEEAFQYKGVTRFRSGHADLPGKTDLPHGSPYLARYVLPHLGQEMHIEGLKEGYP